MRVVFTGQLGIEKKRIINHLANAIQYKLRGEGRGPDSKTLCTYRVESTFADTKTDERNWAEMPDLSRQLEYWRIGFNKLQGELQDIKPKNVFLCMHAVIPKYSRHISPIDWSLLRAFSPDLFITLIDDIIDIWWRLKYGSGRISMSENYSLRELLAWRSSEIMMTDILARNLRAGVSCPHYVVAVKHPVNTLLGLILKPQQLRVYAGYPITDIKKIIRDETADQAKVASVVAKIDQHRATLHSQYTTFDPITIDEFELKEMVDEHRQSTSSNTMTFVRKVNRSPVRSRICDFPLLSDALEYPEVIEGIPTAQVQEAVRNMGEQITWRDYTLLDQVNCMAAYRPNFGRGSTGEQKELMYASMKPITTYAYSPEEDGEILKPFIERGLIRQEYADFLAMIKEHQEEVSLHPHVWSHEARFEL